MGYPDVGIQSYKNGKLVVKRNGERPVPISLNVEYQTKSNGVPNTYKTMVSASVWKDGNETYTLKIPNNKQVASLTINADFPDFDVLDNFFPPLAERYKKLDLNREVLGVYKINEFPVDAIISEKNGIFYLEITRAALEGYLLPADANNFVTLDDSIQLNFKEEAGKVVGIEIKIDAFGVTATGDKK